jgi:hypothetical protein
MKLLQRAGGHEHLSEVGIVENCILCIKELLKTFYELNGADARLSKPKNDVRLPPNMFPNF